MSRDINPSRSMTVNLPFKAENDSTATVAPASSSTRAVLTSLTTVKFLITSDTHEIQVDNNSHPLSNLPKVDVFLHCGDLTEDGDAKKLRKAMEWISSIDAELKLVIAGNHDSHLDRPFYKKLHRQYGDGGSGIAYQAYVFEAVTSDDLRKSGVIYLTEGTYEFKLSSGAVFRIYASPYTPEYGIWGFQYPSNEDRYNDLEDVSRPAHAKPAVVTGSVIPNNVDIIMTHGPAKYILDSTSDGRSAGCEHLRRAIARVKPKLHCFGHIHRGYGAQRIDWGSSVPEDDEINLLPKEWVGQNQAKRDGYASLSPSSKAAMRTKHQTLSVNAAMMDPEGKLTNRPWLVELELPVSQSDVDREQVYNYVQEKLWRP